MYDNAPSGSSEPDWASYTIVKKLYAFILKIKILMNHIYFLTGSLPV